MPITKFDRRAETGQLAEARRAKERKEAELFHRKIGWVVFFVVIIALFVWLWHYLGGPATD